MRRGHRVGTTIAVLIAVVMLVAGSAEISTAEKADLSAHRNLFNGDFGIFFWNAEMWQPDGGRYTAGAIHRFVDNLADNGVDTFVINPNSQVAWYPSKAIPTVLDRYVRDDPTVDNGNWWCPDLLNPALDLKEDGVDCLAEAIKQCRKRGISPWASIRMNDPHLEHSYLRCPLYNNPKYRLGHGLNYEHKEVRDYYFSLARELIEDYDFDGLDFDWLRSPKCCKSPASPETVAVMTRWFADIRGLCDAKATQTGRPFVLGTRTSVDFERMRSIGIDVEGLIKDGTLDYIFPTNVMQTTWDMPHDRLKEEFGEHVTIFGVTELWVNEMLVWATGLNRKIAPYNNSSPPALRANAAGKLVLGADGILQYNFFCGDQSRKSDKVPGLRSCYEALHNLDDLEALRGLSKYYSTCSNLRGQSAFDLPKPLPAAIEPGKRLDLKLPMCDEPDDTGLELTIQVVVEAGGSAPEVAFNESSSLLDPEPTMELLFPLGPADRLMSNYQGYNYKFPIELIKEGWNDIVLLNAAGQSVKIHGVELGVAPIPEPVTGLLLLIGGLCLAGFCWRNIAPGFAGAPPRRRAGDSRQS